MVMVIISYEVFKNTCDTFLTITISRCLYNILNAFKSPSKIHSNQ